MRKPQDVLVPLSLALVFAAACSRTHTDTSTPEPVVTNPPADTETSRTGGDNTSTTSTGTGNTANTGSGQPQTATPGTIESLPPGATVEAPSDAKTTDDEYFGILETINDEAIKQAELAKKWSKSQKVKKLASEMIKDHTALNEREKSTRERLGLRSSDSRLSDDIEGNSEQKIKTLKEVAKGDPFDKSFVDVQVENYGSWINTIDSKLMPAAQMPDLRQELSEARTHFEARLNEAKELQNTLSKNKT
jgi:putative membrane protein